MTISQSCSATIIASAGSRSGKTAFTAALARRWINQGKRVQVFKVGPDFLDPMILARASGRPVYNLDLWMMGADHCRWLLGRAAEENDIVLVESLMGLHDNQPSSAELARVFGLPVTLVLNVAKYAQTATAIVEGMRSYGGGAQISSVVGNMVGSDNHHRLMTECMGELYAGSVRRDGRMVLPERHLGLVQADELMALDDMLDEAANALDDFDIDLSPGSWQHDYEQQQPIPLLLQGKSIAIARDAAFGFIYAANIDLLEAMGAQVTYFSPLANEAVPSCEGLWIPGGYPELHLHTLARADLTRESIIAHHQAGKPLLAECGGMMYLCREITAADGSTGKGCAVLDADCEMKHKFQGLGLQRVDLGEGGIRGHTFHHSVLKTRVKPDRHAIRQDGGDGEPVFISGRTTMTYLHHYFPSGPDAVAGLLA